MHICIYFVQVLSESVSKALKLTGGSSVDETARLVEYMDKFFDTVNVHNFSHGIRARKPFKCPIEAGRIRDLRYVVTANC